MTNGTIFEHCFIFQWESFTKQMNKSTRHFKIEWFDLMPSPDDATNNAKA